MWAPYWAHTMLEVHEQSSHSNAQGNDAKIQVHNFFSTIAPIGCIRSMHLSEIHLVQIAFM